MVVKEELDGIDIDDIGNLEDLLRIVFIHEECGNLKVSLTVESLLEILTKRRNQTFYKPIDVYSVINVNRKEYFFNTNVEYCESVR